MKENFETEGPAIWNLPSSKVKGTEVEEGDRDGGTDDEASSYLDLEVSVETTRPEPKTKAFQTGQPGRQL